MKLNSKRSSVAEWLIIAAVLLMKTMLAQPLYEQIFWLTDSYYISKAVVMAAGAFVQGSSIELSADGPVNEPYAIYFQGGLTWYHAKFGIMMSLQRMYEQGLIELN